MSLLLELELVQMDQQPLLLIQDLELLATKFPDLFELLGNGKVVTGLFESNEAVLNR